MAAREESRVPIEGDALSAEDKQAVLDVLKRYHRRTTGEPLPEEVQRSIIPAPTRYPSPYYPGPDIETFEPVVAPGTKVAYDPGSAPEIPFQNVPLPQRKHWSVELKEDSGRLKKGWASIVWLADRVRHHFHPDVKLAKTMVKKRREATQETIDYHETELLKEEYRRGFRPGLDKAMAVFKDLASGVSNSWVINDEPLETSMTEADKVRDGVLRTISNLAKTGVNPNKLIRDAENRKTARRMGKLGSEIELTTGAKLAFEQTHRTLRKAAATEIDCLETQEEILKGLGCPTTQEDKPCRSLAEVFQVVRERLEPALGTDEYHQALKDLSLVGLKVNFSNLVQVVKETQQRERKKIETDTYVHPDFLDYYAQCLENRDSIDATRDILRAARDDNPYALALIQREFPEAESQDVEVMSKPEVFAIASERRRGKDALEKAISGLSRFTQRREENPEKFLSSLIDIVLGHTQASPEERREAKIILEVLTQKLTHRVRPVVEKGLSSIVNAATPGKGGRITRKRLDDKHLGPISIRETSPEAKLKMDINNLLTSTGQALVGVAVLAPNSLRALLNSNEELKIGGGEGSKVVDGLTADTHKLLNWAVKVECLKQHKTRGISQNMMHPAAVQFCGVATERLPVEVAVNETPSNGSHDYIKQGAMSDAILFSGDRALEQVNSFLEYVNRLGKGILVDAPNEVMIIMGLLAAAADMETAPEGPQDYAKAFAHAAGELAAEAIAYQPQLDQDTRNKLTAGIQAVSQNITMGLRTKENYQWLEELVLKDALMKASDFASDLLRSLCQHLPPELALTAFQPLVDKIINHEVRDLGVEEPVVTIFEALSRPKDTPETPEITQKRSHLISQVLVAITESARQADVEQAAEQLGKASVETSLHSIARLWRCLPETPPELLALEPDYNIPIARVEEAQLTDARVPSGNLNELKNPPRYQPEVEMLGLQRFGLTTYNPIYKTDAILTVGGHILTRLLLKHIGTIQAADLAALARTRARRTADEVAGPNATLEDAAQHDLWTARSTRLGEDVIRWLGQREIISEGTVNFISHFATELRLAGLDAGLGAPGPGVISLEIQPREKLHSLIVDHITPQKFSELSQIFQVEEGKPPVTLSETKRFAQDIEVSIQKYEKETERRREVLVRQK